MVFHYGEQADELDAEDTEGDEVPVGKGVCGQENEFEVVGDWIGYVVMVMVMFEARFSSRKIPSTVWGIESRLFMTDRFL